MYVFEEMIEGKKLTEIINTTHENVKYLPGHKLPENVVSNSLPMPRSHSFQNHLKIFRIDKNQSLDIESKRSHDDLEKMPIKNSASAKIILQIK